MIFVAGVLIVIMGYLRWLYSGQTKGYTIGLVGMLMMFTSVCIWLGGFLP